MSHLAFVWGTDPLTLVELDDESQGLLLSLLLGRSQIPDIDLHAGLAPSAIASHFAQQADRVLEVLAENGLMGRGTHLWLGPESITDCLSPFTRDLREPLLRWAEANVMLAGLDGSLPEEKITEDWLYVIAQRFLDGDEALLRERDEADRSVGILRHRWPGVNFDSVDLCRIEAGGCDTRLAQWRVGADAPILLRLSFGFQDVEQTFITRILEVIGPYLASVNVVLRGNILGPAVGDLLLPSMVLDLCGGEALALPNPSTLHADDLSLYAEGPIPNFPVLSAPSFRLISGEYLEHLKERYGVAGVHLGCSDSLRALQLALWSGSLQRETPVSTCLFQGKPRHGFTECLREQYALSAVAIAALRTMGDPSRGDVEAKEPVGNTRAKKSSENSSTWPSRTIRIKA